MNIQFLGENETSKLSKKLLIGSDGWFDFIFPYTYERERQHLAQKMHHNQQQQR